MSTRKKYSKEFKLDVGGLVLDQSYTRAEAATCLDLNVNMLEVAKPTTDNFLRNKVPEYKLY